MSVHLVNPSEQLLWHRRHYTPLLFVLAAATPPKVGDPILVTNLSNRLIRRPLTPATLWVLASTPATPCAATRSAHGACPRRLGRLWRNPRHPLSRRSFGTRRRTRRVKGDGDVVWASAVATASPAIQSASTKAAASRAAVPRRALGPDGPPKYMWASVQTIRGCPKHCSFCSVWRTDGQKPRHANFKA